MVPVSPHAVTGTHSDTPGADPQWVLQSFWGLGRCEGVCIQMEGAGAAPRDVWKRFGWQQGFAPKIPLKSLQGLGDRPTLGTTAAPRPSRLEEPVVGAVGPGSARYWAL